MRATQRTTAEFLRDCLSQVGSALQAHEQSLGDFLKFCDLAKFARWSLSGAGNAGACWPARGILSKPRLRRFRPGQSLPLKLSMYRFANPAAAVAACRCCRCCCIWRGRRGPVPAIEYPSLALVREVARRTRSRLGSVLAGLPLLGLALLIVAMARPQQGESNATVHASGVDIMLLLDVSGSMQSLDFKLENLPASRVDVVKSVVRKFIVARPNDRIGLTIFAGQPLPDEPGDAGSRLAARQPRAGAASATSRTARPSARRWRRASIACAIRPRSRRSSS